MHSSGQKIHLIYRRIPDEIIEREDSIIEDFGNIVIASSEFRGMKEPLIIEG